MTEEKPQKRSLSDLFEATLAGVAYSTADALWPTGIEMYWKGIGPVPPEKQRTANAAIQLLKIFEDGTAIS